MIKSAPRKQAASQQQELSFMSTSLVMAQAVCQPKRKKSKLELGKLIKQLVYSLDPCLKV
jgi:hypothetical protein